jgi:DNA-binding NarL/FixJ family response regulator
MFQKILIAEDFDFINSGLKAVLDSLKITEIVHVSYCDEALLKLKKATLDNEPFDLLISDLSFEEDHHQQKLKSGEDLITAVRKEFLDLKIIVFSVEDKSFRIQHLYTNLQINGYVWKSRNGQKELEKAIEHLSISNEFYISPALQGCIHPKNTIEITEYDVFIIECLSKGFLQEAISLQLKEKGFSPFSVSSIEKRLKFLKEHFNANNPTHLVAIAKDFGLI